MVCTNSQLRAMVATVSVAAVAVGLPPDAAIRTMTKTLAPAANRLSGRTALPAWSISAARARILATDRVRLSRTKVSSRKAATPASHATANRIGQPQATGETALAAAMTAN